MGQPLLELNLQYRDDSDVGLGKFSAHDGFLHSFLSVARLASVASTTKNLKLQLATLGPLIQTLSVYEFYHRRLQY